MQSAQANSPLSPRSSYSEVGCGLQSGQKGSAKEDLCGVMNSGEIAEAESEEDYQPKKLLPTPILPSPEEFALHRNDHIPYRSWCDHCVEGSGREAAHHHAKHGERVIPTVGFDYMYLGKKGFLLRDEYMQFNESERNEVQTVLVVRDSRSKALFAHAVPAKGVDPARYAVDLLLADIEWLGYTRLSLRSDNEKAIVALLRESLKSLRVETIDQVLEEHSVPYDSQSNGMIEIGCQLVRGKAKIWQSCLESRIGHRIPPKHPLMAWLLEQVSFIMTARVREMTG